MQHRTVTIDQESSGTETPQGSGHRDEARDRTHLLVASLRSQPDEALGRARVFSAQCAVTELLAQRPSLSVDAAYREVFAVQIGPRYVGTIYGNDAGRFEVTAVNFGSAAREMLTYAEWAVTVRNLVTGDSRTIREAWNSRDHIISQPVAVPAGASA